MKKLQKSNNKAINIKQGEFTCRIIGVQSMKIEESKTNKQTQTDDNKGTLTFRSPVAYSAVVRPCRLEVVAQRADLGEILLLLLSFPIFV